MLNRKTFLVILLALISFIVIFYKFNQIPTHLTHDEVEFSRLALSLYGEPYTPYSTYATGHATLYFYILLASFTALGITSFALRIIAAMSGFFAPIVLFFLLNEVFSTLKFKKDSFLIHSELISFFLAVLLVTQKWYFNFARFSFEATFLLLLELLALYFLVRWMKTKNYLDAIGIGVFSGLAYNSYLPGRIFFIIPLVLMLYITFQTKKWKGFGFFLITLILLTAPLNLYLLQHHDVRIAQQSYLHNNDLSFATKLGYISKNLQSTHLMLFYPGKGDIHGLHNYPLKPALNPIMNLLFWSGLVTGVLYYRKNMMFWLFLVYYVVSIVPTVLTYPWENPNMLRTFTSLVPIVFFSGLSLQIIAMKVPKKYMLHTLILIVGLSAAYELRQYYLFQTDVIRQAFEIRTQLMSVDSMHFEKLSKPVSAADLIMRIFR